MLRDVLKLLLGITILFFFISGVSALNYTLLNGTGIYLVTGEPKNIAQGYILSLKSANNDGAVWIQLSQNDTFIKSEILYTGDYFYYNRSNRTIISFKVENVYSGSQEKDLVSLLPVYQYLDYALPPPVSTYEDPGNITDPANTSSGKIYSSQEPLFWVLGILFLLVLFSALRKLW
jgi:hypothetical protein